MTKVKCFSNIALFVQTFACVEVNEALAMQMHVAARLCIVVDDNTVWRRWTGTAIWTWVIFWKVRIARRVGRRRARGIGKQFPAPIRIAHESVVRMRRRRREQRENDNAGAGHGVSPTFDSMIVRR